MVEIVVWSDFMKAWVDYDWLHRLLMSLLNKTIITFHYVCIWIRCVQAVNTQCLLTYHKNCSFPPYFSHVGRILKGTTNLFLTVILQQLLTNFGVVGLWWNTLHCHYISTSLGSSLCWDELSLACKILLEMVNNKRKKNKNFAVEKVRKSSCYGTALMLELRIMSRY